MTVETTNSTISYTGNGSVTTFAYNFLTYSEDHLFIYLDDVEQTSGYSVSGVGDESGGDVTFDVAPINGEVVRIDRTVPETQLIEYQEYGPFPAKTNERGLDLGVMIAQQNAREIGRDSSKKMDKQPLAMEDNIVTFDDEGNSKDSGVNLNSSGVITDLNKVIPFDTLDEAVNETNPLKIFNGAALNIKERTAGNGGGAMWDVADINSVTPNGYDIIQCSGIPSLSIVRRKVKATISFIFDDGYRSAIDDVMPLFKSKGLTCGFAISAALTDSSSATYASISQMLAAQEDGFEIINHGLDPTPLTGTSNGEEFARNQINGNYDKLRQFGFNVQSYVAGNSVLDPSYIPIVRERHSSAYTISGNGLQEKPITPYNLQRPSLFTLGVSGAKALIDEAVKSNGWAAFYDHDPTQTYFPNSMSLANLEEVIDYAIAQGVKVVNPTAARGQLGTDEYNLNQEAVNDSNREQGLTLVNQNLLRDPWYKTITESYSGWADGVGSGDGAYTIANRKNGVFGNEIQLSVGADGTIVDGTYLLQSSAQRRESSFFPTSGNLTFSCEPYLTNADFSDNFELTIGLQQRKTSDNSLIVGAESTALKVDTRARKYSVTIDPTNYSDATYFQVFYRITEKTTGVGGTVLIANPKLEQGDKATRYTDDAPVDINDWDFAESTINVAQTPIPIGAFTRVDLEAKNNNFWQIVNNQFLCRDTGFYSFDLSVSSLSAGPFSDARQLVEIYKNGVSDGKRESNTLSGSLLRWKSNSLKYLKSGDVVEWRLYQDQVGTIDTDNSVYSFLRVCKIG